MPSIDRKITQLLHRSGTVRARELEALGVARRQLSRMVAAGQLTRVGRGLYALPGYRGGEHEALLAVARRAPGILFCLLTALRLHELTTQAPFEVWIAIGNRDHPPRLDYPPLRTVRLSAPSLAAGVETRRIDGVAVRVTSAAKTVADCFKFRNKIGLDVALEALREARRSRKAGADDLWRYAQINRVANVMRPYLEAIA
ncbi:MAG: type IV toxin-antitoxin system AbiEi family antitoxin domain-containing protein [Xanthomonadales bacterium]|nr:type IV toxin-antitoxin system AbiEi family antitoxin domain-containing protein [Xanthomonadales bacterium]ODU94724.1 MAG: transcriptional regulator [Rhodanobacter sp. SCN 66-43]OJY85308.1 MAG: transcriptional regulator [Xanthomonadales bacterium 66-474]